jgi:hypothetical protein
MTMIWMKTSIHFVLGHSVSAWIRRVGFGPVTVVRNTNP